MSLPLGSGTMGWCHSLGAWWTRISPALEHAVKAANRLFVGRLDGERVQDLHMDIYLVREPLLIRGLVLLTAS